MSRSDKVVSKTAPDPQRNADFVAEPSLPSRNTVAFRDVLRTIARESADQNVPVIEGTNLLDSFEGLTCDLVHPSPDGHTRISEILTTRLRLTLPF